MTDMRMTDMMTKKMFNKIRLAYLDELEEDPEVMDHLSEVSGFTTYDAYMNDRNFKAWKIRNDEKYKSWVAELDELAKADGEYMNLADHVPSDFPHEFMKIFNGGLTVVQAFDQYKANPAEEQAPPSAHDVLSQYKAEIAKENHFIEVENAAATAKAVANWKNLDFDGLIIDGKEYRGWVDYNSRDDSLDVELAYEVLPGNKYRLVRAGEKYTLAVIAETIWENSDLMADIRYDG